MGPNDINEEGGGMIRETANVVKEVGNGLFKLVRMIQEVEITIVNFFGQQPIDVTLSRCENRGWVKIQSNTQEDFGFRRYLVYNTTCYCTFSKIEPETGIRYQHFLVYDKSDADYNGLNQKYNIRETHLEKDNNKNNKSRVRDWETTWLNSAPKSAERVPRSIHQAAECGNYEVLECMIDNNADVNALTSYKDEENTVSSVSALHLAACNGRTDCVRLLLDRGAKIDQQDSERWTPLHYASCSGHFKAVKFLVEKGANIHAKTIRQQTPLLLASCNKDPKVYKFLEKKGRPEHNHLITEFTKNGQADF